QQRWKVEVLSLSEGNLGGLKEAVFAARGPKAYGTLRYESGVHRVQRVPTTESQGRIHTSAATVAVLPEAEEVEVKIEDKDLRIHHTVHDLEAVLNGKLNELINALKLAGEKERLSA